MANIAEAVKERETTPRSVSHGRGGAGNINHKPENNGLSPDDLETPTIKSSTYTTGRGGTGNMVPNDPANPNVARTAQDVVAPSVVSKEPAKGTYHWGRGGEGNMVTLRNGEQQNKQRTSSKGNGERRRPSFGGVVEKGKDMLGLGKKREGNGRIGESAVED